MWDNLYRNGFKSGFFLGTFFWIFLAACSHGPDKKESHVPNEQNYETNIKNWQDTRVESLKKNWLSLSGLFLLKEGENTFGSSALNDIVFPKAEAPENMGSFFLENSQVRIIIEPGVEIFSDKEMIHEMDLLKDVDGEATILQWGSLTWHVIQRGDRTYIRLRDAENPSISDFKGIDYYRLDRNWTFEAQFEPHLTPKVIETTTTSGDPSQIISDGAMGFRIKNQYFRLDVWRLGSSDRFQTIFADETSGLETYGAGRFIVIEKSEKDGKYAIDFNKAYNPPCAFTEYATCPLPPPQNRLPLAITAGEKKYIGSLH